MTNPDALFIRRAPDVGDYIVTHRCTGLGVGRFASEAAAREYMRRILPLADWDSISSGAPSEFLLDLGARVRRIRMQVMAGIQEPIPTSGYLYWGEE